MCDLYCGKPVIFRIYAAEVVKGFVVNTSTGESKKEYEES